MKHVWYAGYGSNLSGQRFLCYIRGGMPLFGRGRARGCKDKTLPKDNRSAVIRYPLYFALRDGETKTTTWGPGGVAFIGPSSDETSETICRLWKITEEQYSEVAKQEGDRYDEEITIGEDEGIPILTVTSGTALGNILCPSEAYLKTIAVGLEEARGFTQEEISTYLEGKSGIKGNLARDEILRILRGARV